MVLGGIGISALCGYQRHRISAPSPIVSSLTPRSRILSRQLSSESRLAIEYLPEPRRGLVRARVTGHRR